MTAQTRGTYCRTEAARAALTNYCEVLRHCMWGEGAASPQCAPLLVAGPSPSTWRIPARDIPVAAAFGSSARGRVHQIVSRSPAELTFLLPCCKWGEIASAVGHETFCSWPLHGWGEPVVFVGRLSWVLFGSLPQR